LVFQDLKGRDNLNRYYGEQARYGAGLGPETEWERRRYRNSVKIMSQHLPDHEEMIVDLGCAKGVFLSVMREFGYGNLTGVDLSRACLDSLTAQGFGAVFGEAEHIPLPDGTAGLIHSSNLFEHLYDLRAAALETRRVLKPGGLFFLETPENKDFNGCCLTRQQWLMPEHINFLSVGRLEALLESAGFAILASGLNALYFNDRHVQPLAYALGRKTDFSGGCKIERLSMKKQVLARLALEAERLAETQVLIDELAAEGRGLFLWGLGWAFNFYYAQIDWSRSYVKALVDRNPAALNWRFRGRAVRGLEALSEAGPEDVALGFATANAGGMADYLRSTGFPGRFISIGGLE
jgi:SAM-dependent methyltransferase